MTGVSRRGVFPGSFNPLTIAHLEIAGLAAEAHDLDEVVLAVSIVALDKPTPPGPDFETRIELLEADVDSIDWLSVETTDKKLLADIAEGYDVVVMGADKWEQLHDVRYYDSDQAMRAAIDRLPQVVVATRAGASAPDRFVLETPEHLHDVSSSAARAGKRDLMAPEAAKHWSGRSSREAWTDVDE